MPKQFVLTEVSGNGQPQLSPGCAGFMVISATLLMMIGACTQDEKKDGTKAEASKPAVVAEAPKESNGDSWWMIAAGFGLGWWFMGRKRS